tara:strand:+ start:304 stop:516 length:213 start_codon:yes stop_codon:yes gene_type:complete
MEFIQHRLNLCSQTIEETFQQIKTLQSKHQQLIGYRQALNDVLNDIESDSLNISVESIDPNRKARESKVG